MLLSGSNEASILIVFCMLLSVSNEASILIVFCMLLSECTAMHPDTQPFSCQTVVRPQTAAASLLGMPLVCFTFGYASCLLHFWVCLLFASDKDTKQKVKMRRQRKGPSWRRCVP